MTVTQLIEKLQTVDGSLLVFVEGCDCMEPGAGISIRNQSELVIRRSDGVMNAPYEKNRIEIL